MTIELCDVRVHVRSSPFVELLLSSLSSPKRHPSHQ
jgi:hypothetical protein